MAINRHTLTIADQLRRNLGTITDRHLRATIAAWARAWDDVAPALEAALAELLADGKPSRAAIARAQRLTATLNHIRERLTGLAGEAGARVSADLHGAVHEAWLAQNQMIDSQLPPGVGIRFDKTPTDAFDALVERSTQQITALHKPISQDAMTALRRELVRGIAVGDNPRETVRRVMERTQGAFNGGATRALTIARTEMLDAQRKGAQIADKANADVVAGWVWHSDLGPRTCSACWAMHGTEHTNDEAGPWGHQNCRCARMPRTKSWKELGFDINEPPSLLPSAKDQFAALTPSQQGAILGKRGFAAWSSGKWPMNKWATRKTTDGWRDSFVKARPPGGGSGGRGRGNSGPADPDPTNRPEYVEARKRLHDLIRTRVKHAVPLSRLEDAAESLMAIRTRLGVKAYLDQSIQPFSADELRTAKKLVDEGRFVTALPRNTKVQGQKCPDAIVDASIAEIKTSTGTLGSISTHLTRAAKQSDRIVLDITRSPVDVATVVSVAQRLLWTGQIKYIRIISKSSDLVLGRWKQ